VGIVAGRFKGHGGGGRARGAPWLELALEEGGGEEGGHQGRARVSSELSCHGLRKSELG
jgi:hypothetical protein